ncbi:hypothetical protein GIB67_040541 [Kingdonia uniflora]|uniref:Uncharacterized protein n=1 Tax=Kingdonia uniflora TaxID=39325 RepID=A0A7J7L5F9_9MAGN|nr:hypothetical protein GIB67_040541 [Kingdonia uniflora]
MSTSTATVSEPWRIDREEHSFRCYRRQKWRLPIEKSLNHLVFKKIDLEVINNIVVSAVFDGIIIISFQYVLWCTRAWVAASLS